MRSPGCPPAQDNRRGQVDYARCIVGKDSLDPIHTAHRHPNVRISGQRHRRQTVDLRALDPVRYFTVLSGRGDDQDVVAPVLEMVQHPQDGVRNAVHQGQE
jgi:hypothetical protein